MWKPRKLLNEVHSSDKVMCISIEILNENFVNIRVHLNRTVIVLTVPSLIRISGCVYEHSPTIESHCCSE
jgi:hypothetical protein